MFRKLWWLALLVLVSLTSFIAVNAVAYPGPFSCSGNTDSSLTSAQGLAPPVMDKTFIDTKMVSINTALATSGDEDNGAILPTADTSKDGGLYQNVAMNRFETVFSGNLEVAQPAVIVGDLATLHYGYLSKFPGKNGQSIDYDNRSILPEVVYIGNQSGPGDGETYFAITCDSFAFLPDIGDPVYQASWPAFQTRSVTPEVVYLGNQSPAGDSNFLPSLGNKFAVVCGEDGC